MSDEPLGTRPLVRYIATGVGAALIGFLGGGMLGRSQQAELKSQVARLKTEADELRRDTGRAERQAELAEQRAQSAADDAAAARAFADGLERGLSQSSVARDDAPSAASAVQQNGAPSNRPALVDAEPERCTAITRSGTRCKRKAQAGTDRCWQHRTS